MLQQLEKLPQREHASTKTSHTECAISLVMLLFSTPDTNESFQLSYREEPRSVLLCFKLLERIVAKQSKTMQCTIVQCTDKLYLRPSISVCFEKVFTLVQIDLSSLRESVHTCLDRSQFTLRKCSHSFRSISVHFEKVFTLVQIDLSLL